MSSTFLSHCSSDSHLSWPLCVYKKPTSLGWECRVHPHFLCLGAEWDSPSGAAFSGDIMQGWLLATSPSSHQADGKMVYRGRYCFVCNSGCPV